MHGIREVVDLKEKLGKFTATWTPHQVSAFNGQKVVVVHALGEFPWHHHDLEDEMFLTVEGEFIVRFRDRELRLGPGQIAVVPRGVEHQTAAEVPTSILHITRDGSRNSGNLDLATAVTQPTRI